MIFGRSNAELNRAHLERIKRRETWHSWFAWYPVRLEGPNGRIAWLEWIEHRSELIGYPSYTCLHYYRKDKSEM
jgi:hypothetical protein